jgi:hypothetical protein
VTGVCAFFLGALVAAPQPPLVHVNATNAAAAPWLARFNAWRANTGTSALTENTTWSAGDYAHALYMVKNDLVTHYETPGTPYYTTAGDTAARNSNIYVSSTTATTDEQAIDWWMQAPFHSMGMMDPRLTSTGFGSYREVKSGWDMAAAVDVLRGNSFSGGQFPLYFPGDGSYEPLTTYGGGEFPDPLQACPGYAAPTGLPVYIEVGGNVATTAGPVHTFTGNGVALDNCVIDSSNPSVGSSLTYRGGVVLIPRQPLQSGVKYTVALTVNGLPYTWSFTVGPLSSNHPVFCRSVSATTTPASPSPSGLQVTVSATSTGCPNPQYRFWVSPPGQGWSIGQDYSASGTFVWTATGASGANRLEVDARDASESYSYDVVTNFTYSLSGCTAAALSPAPSSPRNVGTVVVVSATATCPGTPTYRFWTGQNGMWKIAQDYGASNVFNWSTAGLVSGVYGLEVDVRDQGSTDSYQQAANVSYTLGAPQCAIPTLNANPTGGASTASTATFTATTTGCPAPNYRFWVGQGGIWKMVQDYSAGSTFTWNTNGYAAGAYGVEVDVRDQSSSASYDHVANIAYTLGGCTSAHLATDKASPQQTGATILLTASAACPGTAEYRFWVGRDGMWTIVQDFGASNTFSWNTTGKLQGTYGLEVDVRDHGSTSVYEAVANVYFTLALPPCTAAHLNTDKASPQAHGATIVLTGSATCTGTAEYRFWVRDLSGAWHIVQDYSTTSTFSWNTTGLAPGTYGLEVDVRNQGSAVTYETVANLNFAIT